MFGVPSTVVQSAMPWDLQLSRPNQSSVQRPGRHATICLACSGNNVQETNLGPVRTRVGMGI
jgi:hypothetical protein